MTLRPNVEILYCIRAKDGISRAIQFKEALSFHPPKYSKLTIICKSDVHDEFTRSIRAIFPTDKVITVQDIGFDLGAYRTAMLQSTSKYFILLASSSLPTIAEWDSYLVEPVLLGTSRLVGSMASMESLSTTVFADLKRAFRAFLQGRKLDSSPENPATKKLNLRVINHFFSISMHFLKRILFFPGFPNSHLRTTGICVEKAFYLSVVSAIPRTKNKCFRIESGRRSLTEMAKKRGFNPLLGTVAGPLELSNPEIKLYFRSHAPKTPVIVDHHQLSFANLPFEVQEELTKRTWG